MIRSCCSTRCDDLDDWTYLGPLLTIDDPVAAAVVPANIWECPNLFQLGGRWVLLLSQWRHVDGTHELAGVRYLVGDLIETEGGLRFVAESGGTVDDGPTFYAPQVLVDDDRALLWGWAWEGTQRTRRRSRRPAGPVCSPSRASCPWDLRD